MRILMLSQFVYPPSLGGEERFVTDLSRELVARGHDVAVVALWLKDLPEFEVQQGVRIYRVRSAMQKMTFLFSDTNHPYAPPFPDPGVMRELRRIIQVERPEIVHAHNWLVHSFTPLKAWSKARFVVSLHDYSLICVQKRLMQQETCCTGPGAMKCLKCSTQYYGLAKGPLSTLTNFYWGRREMRAVDMFLPVSQATADGNQLDTHHLPYTVMPNFVPDIIDVLENDDPLLAQLPEEEFLLFVGDVTHDKGVEALLQAYRGLHTSLPLVLIGRMQMPDLPAQLPQNVSLLGAWPHNAVMAAWQRCAIGLVPSIVAETFGIVALEAMYMGKPVIATRSGGLTDVVVDQETGLLVPPDDPHALQVALQTLLDDPALRQRMGVRAKQRVVQFQATSVVSQFEQVYQDLLGIAPIHERITSSAGSR